jgi:hypothetical protein
MLQRIDISPPWQNIDSEEFARKIFPNKESERARCALEVVVELACMGSVCAFHILSKGHPSQETDLFLWKTCELG